MTNDLALAAAHLKKAKDRLDIAKAQHQSAEAAYQSAKTLVKAFEPSETSHTQIGGQRTQLCESCSAIPILKILGKQRKSSRTHRKAVGDLFRAVEHQSSCALCKFLIEAFQIEHKDQAWQLQAKSNPQDAVIYFTSDPDGKTWYNKVDIDTDIPSSPFVWLQTGPPSPTGQPHICASFEPTSSPASPLDIYVIDVHEKIVVPYCAGTRFIALSYVWGRGNTHGVGQITPAPGQALPNSIPQTMVDAITFVERIGQRYLWIDQLCIDQANHEVKMRQINLMDRIYASAYLTLVNLDGPDADWGLPGISRPLQQVQQPVATLDSGRLMATFIYSSGSFHDCLSADGKAQGATTWLADDYFREDGSGITLGGPEWDFLVYGTVVFQVRLVRRDGEPIKALRANSLQSKMAIGDQWTLIGQNGQSLWDEAGEYQWFEWTDHLFRLKGDYSQLLLEQNSEADLMYVAHWPRIRDCKGSNKWLYNRVSALV
ncbi:MAG: hypothetical protein Q9208_006712 [Pyrenodesmia sp. 3 TL-2023]